MADGDAVQLTDEEAREVCRVWDAFASFKKTEVVDWLGRLPQSTIGIFSGNQAGKTSSVAYNYVKRLLGLHPIPEKNKLMKKVRCMSSTLPASSDPNEQDNTQYLELKKLLPPEIIKRDITSRSQTMVVRRPDGSDTVFEFRSSKQELQDLGKIQLSSVWHDEETPKAHREECRMRLLKEGGEEIFSLTPTNALSYTFDEVWQQASVVLRTVTIADRYNLPKIEKRKLNPDIAVICMATDDNPTLEAYEIDRIFDAVDPAEIDLRRYGQFKQVTGRVYKTYDPRSCFISFAKYFQGGVPYNWFHARGIDYHESRTPWSVGWLAASPEDEWFLWKQFHPSIDGPHAMNTYEIAKSIVRKSDDYNFTLNLIDPLAKKKQSNSNTSVVDDLNRHFDALRTSEGMGTPSFWEGWDTKGTAGRGEVMRRFKNAVRVGVPFNNGVMERGRFTRLPTLWICDTAPDFHKSVMTWRYGEYTTSQTKIVNDPKAVPQQRFSHDCMVLEGLAKDYRLLNAAHFHMNSPRQAHGHGRSATGR